MTLQSVFGGILIPEPRSNSILMSSFRTITLDASGEKAAAVFKIPKTGTITKIGFPTGAITQMTNPFKVGLYTVDAATGFPTATAYGSMVAGTGTPTANTWSWYTLGTSATATVNNDVAVVIEFNSFATGDNIVVNIGVTRETTDNRAPYCTAFLAGAWTDQTYPPNFAIEYSDGSIQYIPGVTPYSSLTQDIFASTSNPDRRGIRFQVPFPCRMIGGWAHCFAQADMNFILYGSDGATQLASISFDGDIRNGSANMKWLWDSPVTLTKDTNYYLVGLPTTTSSNRLYYFDVTDDGANTTMDAEPMGDLFHYATANGVPTGTGSWTTNITRRYLMGIIVDQLDDGAGGGGGGLLTHPGMQGGMRG